MPSTSAQSEATRSASFSGARSTNHTPSSKASSCCCAKRSARRVLPQPPMPVSVSSRVDASSRARSASAASRPMKRVRGSGRLWRGRWPSGRRGRRSGCRLARRRQAVAVAGQRGDRARAEQLAQVADLRGDVVLFHDQARPDQVEQLLLGDEPLVALGQHEQQVEGAAAESHRLAAHAQHPLGRVQLEMVEAQRFGGSGRWQEGTPGNGRRSLDVV